MQKKEEQKKESKIEDMKKEEAKKENTNESKDSNKKEQIEHPLSDTKKEENKKIPDTEREEIKNNDTSAVINNDSRNIEGKQSKEEISTQQNNTINNQDGNTTEHNAPLIHANGNMLSPLLEKNDISLNETDRQINEALLNIKKYNAEKIDDNDDSINRSDASKIGNNDSKEVSNRPNISNVQGINENNSDSDNLNSRNQDSQNQLQYNSIEAQLVNSIHDYEKTKQQLQIAGQDTGPTQQVINSLQETLKTIKAKKAIPSMAQQESEREKGLKEIFYFYTRQQIMLGNNPTFEEIINEVHTLNIGEFMKFAKDFKVPLPISSLRDLYKKSAYLSREMKWEHFQLFIPKIAYQIHHEKLSKYRKALKETNIKIRDIQRKLDAKQKENAEIAEEKKKRRA